MPWPDQTRSTPALDTGADGPEQEGAAFVHAIVDAPAVDFLDQQGMMVDDLSYGYYANRQLGSHEFLFDVRRHGDGSLYETYNVDLTAMEDESVTIVLLGLESPPGGALDRSIQLRIVSFSGHAWSAAVVTGVDASGVPETPFPRGNYPSPFSASTHVVADLPWMATVTVEVYDITGRLIATKRVGPSPAGDETTLADHPSGVYPYRVVVESVGGRYERRGTMTVMR